MKYKEGDDVVICGKRTKLVRRLSDIEGGWMVEPKVQNIGYWNEQEMRPSHSADKDRQRELARSRREANRKLSQ